MALTVFQLSAIRILKRLCLQKHCEIFKSRENIILFLWNPEQVFNKRLFNWFPALISDWWWPSTKYLCQVFQARPFQMQPNKTCHCFKKLSYDLTFEVPTEYLLFYYYFFREGGRGRERNMYESETSVGCLLHAPYLGSSPQTGHVPGSGSEPATFLCKGWPPTNWATPVKAEYDIAW